MKVSQVFELTVYSEKQLPPDVLAKILNAVVHQNTEQIEWTLTYKGIKVENK